MKKFLVTLLVFILTLGFIPQVACASPTSVGENKCIYASSIIRGDAPTITANKDSTAKDPLYNGIMGMLVAFIVLCLVFIAIIAANMRNNNYYLPEDEVEIDEEEIGL